MLEQARVICVDADHVTVALFIGEVPQDPSLGCKAPPQLRYLYRTEVAAAAAKSRKKQRSTGRGSSPFTLPGSLTAPAGSRLIRFIDVCSVHRGKQSIYARYPR